MSDISHIHLGCALGFHYCMSYRSKQDCVCLARQTNLTCFSCDLRLASSSMCSLSCCHSPACTNTARMAWQHIFVPVISSASLFCFSSAKRLSTASLVFPCAFTLVVAYLPHSIKQE